MLFKSYLLPIILAGLMNGSFVIPARYVKNFSHEKIWLYHTLIGLAVIPWVLQYFLLPDVFSNYFSLSLGTLIFLIVSGIIFGCGQICFAYAIEIIGIGLSFTINIGIGVTIGSLFVVFLKNTFFTTQGYFVIFSVGLIVASLILHYFSERNRQAISISNYPHPPSYHSGWLLASLAGIASGLQNIAFVIVAFHSIKNFQDHNSFWVWPPFLLAAAIPMLFGFAYRMKQSNMRLHDNKTSLLCNLKNFFFIPLMGIFFTGSLALYSTGMSKMDHDTQIVGWPVFMVSIIFVSQLWGLNSEKVKELTLQNKILMLISILLLIAAILVLAFEAA